jgi:hypothetical protein
MITAYDCRRRGKAAALLRLKNRDDAALPVWLTA